MKFLFSIILLILINNCSFDDKTGIWKNEQNLSDEKDIGAFKDFRNVNLSENKYFDQIINRNKNFNFILDSSKSTQEWNDEYFSKNNVIPNILYNNNDNILKGKKLSRSKLSSNILFKNNLLIASDVKGNLIVYSIDRRKILHKYNFYKKKYRNINKKMNMTIVEGNLYVSDNIGFLYAYDFKLNKIIWAKQFPVPFRSNIKINNKKLYIANENNSLFIINYNDGNIIRKIPTEEVLIKNKYMNNLSMDNKNLFYLNTFGTLYSINQENLRLNWFININPSLDGSLNDLFTSREIKIYRKNLIILSNNGLQVIDSLNGSTKYIIPINSEISPLVYSNYIFAVSKNNLLVALETNSGNIIYSFKIDQKIAQFLNTKKKDKIKIKYIRIINDKIVLFLKNSYVIEFSVNGKIEDLYKLPSKINSKPIFINNSMIYLNKGKKLIKLN